MPVIREEQALTRFHRDSCQLASLNGTPVAINQELLMGQRCAKLAVRGFEVLALVG